MRTLAEIDRIYGTLAAQIGHNAFNIRILKEENEEVFKQCQALRTEKKAIEEAQAKLSDAEIAEVVERALEDSDHPLTADEEHA